MRYDKRKSAAGVFLIVAALCCLLLCLVYCGRDDEPVPADNEGIKTVFVDATSPTNGVVCNDTVCWLKTPEPVGTEMAVKPSATLRPRVTAEPTSAPTDTPEPELTFTPEPTVVATPAPVVTPGPTSAPIETPAPVFTPAPTVVPTAVPTATPKPTSVPVEYPIHYSDGDCTITICREWYHNAWCYAAHLQFTDYTRFGSECANGRYGHGVETTSHCGSRIGALLCVNGDYSAPSLHYPVVRQGKVWNDGSYYAPGSYNSYNGKLFWTYEGSPTGGQLLSQLVSQHKVTDSFTFGPEFLRDGRIVRVSPGGSRAQRTFMGTNGHAGDIWIVVSDGRHNDGRSAGLTDYECASYLLEKGCVFGIPLDGGGSSAMWWRGRILNAARGNERAVVDFIFFK